MAKVKHYPQPQTRLFPTPQKGTALGWAPVHSAMLGLRAALAFAGAKIPHRKLRNLVCSFAQLHSEPEESRNLTAQPAAQPQPRWALGEEQGFTFLMGLDTLSPLRRLSPAEGKWGVLVGSIRGAL